MRNSVRVEKDRPCHERPRHPRPLRTSACAPAAARWRCSTARGPDSASWRALTSVSAADKRGNGLMKAKDVMTESAVITIAPDAWIQRGAAGRCCRSNISGLPVVDESVAVLHRYYHRGRFPAPVRNGNPTSAAALGGVHPRAGNNRQGLRSCPRCRIGGDDRERRNRR